MEAPPFGAVTLFKQHLNQAEPLFAGTESRKSIKLIRALKQPGFDLCLSNPNEYSRYSLKCWLSPYTSRMDKSLEGLMLSILILYASCTMRSRMASAKGESSPPN